MSRIYIAKGSSAVNAPFGVGVSAAEGNNRNMIIHGYSVGARGADFAADVEIDLIPGYSALSATNAVDSLTIVNPTATYTSDFTSDADGWIDNTASGVTYLANQTIGGVTGCLKITADAGGDVLSIKKPTQCTVGKYYKVVISVYRGAAEAGLSHIGLGVEGDNWNLVADHISGENVALAAAETWKTCTIYGKATATDLEIAGFTDATGNTEDSITAEKYVAIGSIVMYDITTQVDGWTASSELNFGFSGVNNSLSCDAGAGGTATATLTGTNAAASGEIYRCSFTVDDWTAAIMTATVCGDSAWTVPDADGTYTFYAESDGTDTVIFTADGDAEMNIEAINVKKLTGVNSGNSIYKHTIRSTTDASVMIPFPIPVPVGNGGWWMQFSPGGTSCAMDVNVFYEIR